MECGYRCRAAGALPRDTLRFVYGLVLNRLAGHFGLGSNDVDAALEIRAVVDADAGALDVSDETPLFADRDLFGDFHVAADAAENDHFASLDVRANLAVGTYGEQALRFQRAFDIAIHQQFLPRADLAFHAHGRPNRGRLRVGCARRRLRIALGLRSGGRGSSR